MYMLPQSLLTLTLSTRTPRVLQGYLYSQVIHVPVISVCSTWLYRDPVLQVRMNKINCSRSTPLGLGIDLRLVQALLSNQIKVLKKLFYDQIRMKQNRHVTGLYCTWAHRPSTVAVLESIPEHGDLLLLGSQGTNSMSGSQWTHCGPPHEHTINM